jgi:hypothetical protein
LYLIKPKPRDIKIPSLMFILDAERKEHRYETMLKKIIRGRLRSTPQTRPCALTIL